jgi:hypothetical protein
VAGIAAMVLTGILGTAMGLNNTAAFMSSCVAFVAVAMWMDGRIALRRKEKAQETARERAREAARETAPDPALDPALDPGTAIDSDASKRER